MRESFRQVVFCEFERNNEYKDSANAKKANEDLKYMKETMRYDRKKENKDDDDEEYFNFQEKINYILEEQEEIFSLHMTAIKVLGTLDRNLI